VTSKRSMRSIDPVKNVKELACTSCAPTEAL